ncbi:MAG: VacJ family lipoprotein [Desulfovibrio sp.]|nr:VacJ family lipoprotein [Desulfovibrio sp.]
MSLALQSYLAAHNCDYHLASKLLPSAGYLKSDLIPKEAIRVKEPKRAVKERGLAAGENNSGVANDLDDYEDATEVSVYDPFEGWNRFWFRFNDGFYLYVAEPVYRGWQAVTPASVRWGLKNFLHNALFPVRFVNNILQFKFKAAGVEFGRFMMNTMSSAGFSNPASTKKTIVPMDSVGEDFGQTLGVWGLGHGPYIVWPFIGPSSLRETFGLLGDMFAGPFLYIDPWWASSAAAFTLRFNNLDEVLPLYKDIKGAALDPYLAMREAYIRFRNEHTAK